MGYTTTNPYTNEVVKTFPDATDAEVDAALDQAHAAFLSWRTTSFDERSKVLLKAAELARTRREELARLNDLYLALKRGEREEMMRDYPFQASLEERARHFWNTTVAFGVNHPDKHKVMLLLRFSDHINEQVKRLGGEGYEALEPMLQECLGSGALKDQPAEFGMALLLSLMQMTITFILQHPAEAERFRDAGFTAFWHAVTTP